MALTTGVVRETTAGETRSPIVGEIVATYDLDEINAEPDPADVALVIRANDVDNPIARSDRSSPIYGMRIVNPDHARNVICVNRGQA